MCHWNLRETQIFGQAGIISVNTPPLRERLAWDLTRAALGYRLRAPATLACGGRAPAWRSNPGRIPVSQRPLGARSKTSSTRAGHYKGVLECSSAVGAHTYEWIDNWGGRSRTLSWVGQDKAHTGVVVDRRWPYYGVSRRWPRHARVRWRTATNWTRGPAA